MWTQGNMKNQEEDSSPETGLDLKLINEISENEFKNSMRCKQFQEVRETICAVNEKFNKEIQTIKQNQLGAG